MNEYMHEDIRRYEHAQSCLSTNPRPTVNDVKLHACVQASTRVSTYMCFTNEAKRRSSGLPKAGARARADPDAPTLMSYENIDAMCSARLSSKELNFATNDVPATVATEGCRADIFSGVNHVRRPNFSTSSTN